MENGRSSWSWVVNSLGISVVNIKAVGSEKLPSFSFAIQLVNVNDPGKKSMR